MSLLKRLTGTRPILLDGATGTELNRRGVSTALPLWSARALLEAPDVLRQVHADYARAGAELITANTFRTHRRSLAQAGLGARAASLTQQAVALARAGVQAAQPSHPVYVAGSLAPLEDCYSPTLVPPQAECEREHAEMAQNLAAAGVDLILVETMNTIREALAATRAARATGLPVFTSFVCRTDQHLFSGETITAAVQAIAPLGVAGLLINCTPSTTIHLPFGELREAVRAQALPIPYTGLYANIGHTNDVDGWTSTADVAPLEYARLASAWMRQGANVIGGCCGTTPAHISALRVIFD
ncbi:MAG: homocysteine S-methyltransferase family protein [Anaerolineales bacterium]|nr:homocysteine S-methyltransferase family protein [Anaerolineales bacterium]